MELTQARVRELFDYRADGVLIRKTKQSIRTKIGEEIGCLHKATGYLVARVDGTLFKVHRLVYLWHHGWLPAQVDHRDMNRLNNRIENLRSANKSENMRNRSRQSNNSSGYKGVSPHKSSGKWAAEITSSGERVRLGLFDTPEEAHAAYAEAAERIHGEFARPA